MAKNKLIVSMAIILLACSLTSAQEARNYFMGFTPFPWDMTIDAVISTRNFITENGDIVAHHLDSGVPWTEALDDKPFHKNLEDDWKNRIIPGRKVLVSVTPLNGGRSDIALYRGENENMPLPDMFRGKELNDLIVKKAYLNYCRRALKVFQPDYFAIGIEVNELIHNSPSKWQPFVELYRYTYTELKKDHPDLPIFATFSLHNLTNTGWSDVWEQQSKIKDFIQYSDIVGISYYPFMAGQSENPVAIFDWIRSFTDKPLAVTETGYPAEDIILKSLNLTIPGDPQKQAAFYKSLLDRANQDRYLFVISFLYRDYDQLWNKIKATAPEFFVVWKDCGLLDENGKERQAFGIWRDYLNRSKQTSEEQPQSFNASVRINSQILNTVKPLIFGDNIEWTNNGMGFWLPQEGRFDQKLVDELREVGVRHLRYPGGTLSDYFEWRKALGKERQPITNPFADNKPEYPGFGPEEFMSLCRELKIPGTITLNAGTGNAEDAVHWVDYFRENEFDVTAFAVGNEIYMAKPEEPISKTVQQYIDFYLKCESGIRKIDPKIKLGAIGLHDSEAMPLSQNREWMMDILKSIGDKMDFIDVHNGYAPVVRGVGFDPDKLYPDNDFALCFMGASQYVRDNIEATKSDLEKYAPDNGKNIEIHITEYGPLVYPIKNERAFEDLAWNRSLTGALYLACLFNVLLKEPKVASANHLPLCQDVFGALIGIRGPERKTWRNIVYYVFQMYSGMSGREVLDVSVDSPTYSTPSMGIVPNMNEVPYVDAGAYRTQDGSKISLFLINRDLKRSASIEIDPGIENFEIQSIKTLTADSYKSQNTPENPDKAVFVTVPQSQVSQAKPFSLILPKHSLTVIELARR